MRWPVGFRDNYRDTSAGVMAQVGTMRMVRVNQGLGGLPTRNFQQGQFEGFEKISFETMSDTILVGRDTCFGCPVALQVRSGGGRRQVQGRSRLWRPRI
jgi:aldehyde:ferredoxin oxidoreductase